MSIIIIPIITAIVVEFLKFIIPGNKRARSIKGIFAYSGMPSGHAAVVVSLATIVGLTQGVASPLLGVVVIFAILTIRDAVGLRRYLGAHGQVLNILVKDLRADNVLDENYPHLLEKIGHTYAQVLVGAIIGFLVSVSWYYLF